MGKGPQESAKGVKCSTQKKGKLDFYFRVINGVKNAYSLYTNQHILDHFLRDNRITHSGEEQFVVCLPCKLSDRVSHVNRASDDTESKFFFMYDIFFTILGLRLSFTDFEVECLNFVNVAFTNFMQTTGP